MRTEDAVKICAARAGSMSQLADQLHVSRSALYNARKGGGGEALRRTLCRLASMSDTAYDLAMFDAASVLWSPYGAKELLADVAAANGHKAADVADVLGITEDHAARLLRPSNTPVRPFIYVAYTVLTMEKP